MKKIILLGALVAGNSWSFTCRHPVNSKRVVVFVDANNSPTESNGAERAACERGEAFKKLPPGGESLDAKVLERELKTLAGSNKAVSSMVISGHDGGGSIHGKKAGSMNTKLFRR